MAAAAREVVARAVAARGRRWKLAGERLDPRAHVVVRGPERLDLGTQRRLLRARLGRVEGLRRVGRLLTAGGVVRGRLAAPRGVVRGRARRARRGSALVCDRPVGGLALNETEVVVLA